MSMSMSMRKRGASGRRVLRLMSIFGLLVILGMLMMACGSEEDIGGRTGSSGGDSGPTPTTPVTPATPTGEIPDSTPDASPTTGEIEHPTGEDEVIIRVAWEGGFMMPQMLVTRLPLFQLNGNGCYIVQGPQIEIYPQPALPNLLETCLTEDGVQQILQEAEAAGLLDGDAEYPIDTIADAVTTVFTVNAGGETIRVEAYALDFDASDVPSDALTPEQVEAREKLAEFLAKMNDLGSWMPADAITSEERIYEIERLQIVAQPAEVANAGMETPEGIEIQQLEWPLETPIVELGEEHFLDQGRCFVLEGADLGTILPMLKDANQLTQWSSGGEQYQFLYRPLLAGEEGCEGTAA